MKKSEGEFPEHVLQSQDDLRLLNTGTWVCKIPRSSLPQNL